MKNSLSVIAASALASVLALPASGTVTLSEFSDFNLTFTYERWTAGTFTSNPTNYRVEAEDFGGGGFTFPSVIDGSGCDTLQVTLDVNADNLGDTINIILRDGDGTQTVYNFSGLSTGAADPGVVLTASLDSPSGSNNPGTKPGLDLDDLTGFDLQGSFANGNPGLLQDLVYDKIELTSSGVGPITEIPNKDFETPDGASWSSTTLGGGTFVFSYPTADGNPSGRAVIDHTANDGGIGLLQANDATSIPIAGLELVGGQTYTFSVDMKIESGANIGGLKVDFAEGSIDGGSTGYLFPPGGGTGDWVTYNFDVTLPTDTATIDVCLVSGEGSVVSFDNVCFNTTAVGNPIITSIPNGDFEIGGGGGWAENSGGGTYSFEYPAADGNPNGFGIIDNSSADGGFGVLVGNNDDIIPLEGLNLVAGNTYLFSHDMKILSGPNLGGVKYEFFQGTTSQGTTGDLFPTPAEDTSVWGTYTFSIEIPPCADGLKVVPLWGADSRVGFDNFTISTTPEVLPPPSAEVPNGDFEEFVFVEGIDANVAVDWRWETDGFFNFYNETEGNPGGFVEIDATENVGFYGVLIADNNEPILLSSLGLERGQSYTFSVDMKILQGIQIGALNVEFFSGADLEVSETGGITPAVIGGGANWETYDFVVDIPEECVNGIKVVLIGALGSSVGFDNMVINPIPIDQSGPKIISTSYSGGEFSIVFTSRVGYFYNLLFSEDLEEPFVEIESSLEGDGSNLTYTDAFATATEGFYKIEEVESEP